MSEYSSYMWSVPDWRSDEMSWQLDNREQGIYRNLLDECWVSGSINSDPEELARLVREPLDYFAGVWAKIRKKFRSIDKGGRLVSKRQEQDRDRLDRVRHQRQQRARKAAEKRWKIAPATTNKNKELHATSNQQASQIQIQTQKERDPSLLDSPSIPHKPSFQRGKRARVTCAPDQLSITDAMRGWAAEHGITIDLTQETAAMLDWHRAKGQARVDWIAAWRNWMRNAMRFSQRKNGNHEHYQDRIARENRETAARFDCESSGADGNGDRPKDQQRAYRAVLSRPK